MSTASARHMGRVAALGCVVCRNLGHGETPAEVHHVREDAMPRNDFLTIPLCPSHHRLGGLRVAVHAGRESWEALYGDELTLLGQTIKDLGK